MLPPLATVTAMLPADQPRYFMGLGDPIGMVEVVALGVDMFDCVLPTRLARHGTLLTSAGRLNIKRAEFARSDEPLDPDLVGQPRCPLVAGLPAPPAERRRADGRTPSHAAQLGLGLRFHRPAAPGDRRAGRFDAFRREVHEVWA